MKHKATKQILSILLAVVMLIGLLPVAAPPASAAGLVGRNTISSVAITVDRPIAGEPLSTCVPKTTLCQITCTWGVLGPRGFTEIPASTIAQEGTSYYLAMELTPTLDLYTFADSVTGTVNGNTVTVQRTSSTRIACMVRLTPATRATDVAVSVPQPAWYTTPGTPTAAGGRTVTDVSWWRSSTGDPVNGVQLAANEVFTGSYNYWMEATVKASSDEVFDENTTVTVNGQATTILSRNLAANTITFRYDVSALLTVAGNIYVADGSGGYWHLTHGDTRTNDAGTYTAAYQNGILTLTNTGDSTISGFYNKSDSTLYYGIFADGDLTLHVNGDFRFDLSGTPDTAALVYGIYTKGNLTLVNKSAADCTVSFTPADGVLATHGSSGIHCENGSLTVENEGGGDFTLNADAVGVRPVDGAVKANFTNNGIYADVSITIGDNCTVNATAADVALSAKGETISRGIYAYRDLTIRKNAVVTATGGDINPSQSATTLNIGFSQYCYGVQVRAGDITVNGGTLTAKGGDIDYGDLTGSGNATNGRQESYGISAGGITLNGGAITATAGICRSSALVTGSLSEGIFCSNLTVSSGTLEARADDAWLESTGLCVMNNLTQTGGTINGTGDLAVCSGDSTGPGSRGIYVVDTLTASGGSLTGTGGTMGNKRPSVGLQAGTIDLSGTARVTGIGGLTTGDTIETTLTGSSTFVKYPGDSIGVWTFHDLTVDGSAVLTATGGTVKGDYTSAAEAMSVGLYIRADAPTISGSGKIVATGGETVYGGKNNKNISDTSRGIYGDGESLTIDETTVIATGGSVCASTATSLGLGYNYGGISYGMYLPQGALTLQNGAELTATGGVNTRYSTTSTQPSKYNDSYGAYIKGDITVTDSVLTATGGISHRTVGLLHGGAVTLNGLGSRLTASANEYLTEGYASSGEGHTSSGKYSYGALNGSTSEAWPGGDYTVNDGILLLQGQTAAMAYENNNTLTAASILCSQNWDGSNAVGQRSPAKFSDLSLSFNKYVKADSSTVIVSIKDWTYGNAANTPTYTAYAGEPTILWTGTTRAGKAYSSDTAPTDAGSYTVTVTYPGGQTGSADFTVKPRSITTFGWNVKEQLTYNGEEQTQSVTIKYGGKELVEGADYTLSGNKQTNAGNYTLTITGTGNFEGTNTGNFTVYQKTPTAEDFNIPEIGEYTYTGEQVELPLPTLKEPYTGGGTITLYYDGQLTPPSAVGTYTVTFNITEGTNFIYENNLEYGTLVIKAADSDGEKHIVIIESDMHAEGLVLGANTVANCQAELNTSEMYVVIKNINGETITDTDLVGTGATITYYNRTTNAVVKTVTVVLYGDVNGDGIVTTADKDTVMLKTVGAAEIENVWFSLAADTNGDGAVDAFDAALINLQIANDYLISQYH